jgi:hypothetical protein
MAMKDMGFGKSDKDLAKTFGISVSDMKKIKKQIASEVTKPAPKKSAVKKASNGSNTKPFNVRLIKPDEIIKDKPKGPKVVGRTPKPKGLNDYLDKGKTPPSKNKKLPSDADVILKGYNDKKTIAKLKESKKKSK